LESDDASVQQAAGAGVLHVDVKGIVHRGVFALPKGRGPDRFWFAKKDECAIDEVRAEIPEDAGNRKIRLFAPGIRLRAEPEAVEPGFVLHNRAQDAGLNQLLYRDERAIPTAVLVNREQLLALRSKAHE